MWYTKRYIYFVSDECCPKLERDFKKINHWVNYAVPVHISQFTWTRQFTLSFIVPCHAMPWFRGRIKPSVPSEDWPLVLSDQQAWAPLAAWLVHFAKRIPPNVSILISVPISALIGQSDGKPNYYYTTITYMNACISVWWTYRVLPLIARELEARHFAGAKCKGPWHGYYSVAILKTEVLSTHFRM